MRPQRPARTTKVASALAATLAMAALGGCGDGADPGQAVASPGKPSTSKGGAATPDACRLITTDEVALVLSEHNADHATYSVTASTGSDGSCTYAWTANEGGDEFTVNEFPASSYVAQPGVEPRPIPGIGDEAFEEVGSFYARIGDHMINVVNLQEGQGADEALLSIAIRRIR